MYECIVCGGWKRESFLYLIFFHTGWNISKDSIFSSISTQKHSMSWCKSLQITSEVTPTERQTYLYFGEKTFLIETKNTLYTYTDIERQCNPNCPSWVCSNKPAKGEAEAIHCKIQVFRSFTSTRPESPTLWCHPLCAFSFPSLHTALRYYSLTTNQWGKKLSSCCR